MRAEAEATASLGENRSEWPEVAIIVLNWNNYKDTAECLTSLKNINYPNYRVIVVDNGSTDGSGTKLKNEFEWCDFVFNEENLGFAAGNNEGIEIALEYDVEYVLLLNNDMILERSALSPLVETAEKHEDVAMVSGVISYFGLDDLWYTGGELGKITTKIKMWNSIQKVSEYETGFITGAMMLLPAKFLKKNGYLDDRYFFGGEDKEMSQRVLNQGKKLMVNPASRAEHKVSSSSGKRNSFSYYHSTISKLEFSKNHLTGIRLFLFYVYFISSRIVRFVQWTVTGQFSLIFATLSAIYNYLTEETRKKRTDLISNE
ncbi:glycosyltransferase family 2 protein [Halorubrum distributum]|uniref:Glycosyltransferase n=1 Tax=Halorubrum distributum JCM 13916 TaxID=1230455 RepID=M0PM39_9EURY|nr:glycosyltransferase family 2 protein [Halorubrum arcis]EMA71062.1 glycosyltransferase [Halorubrum arcis JCM 13916]